MSRESAAMPSARVAIWAEMMLTPWAASVPAMSAKSPGTSRVTTTRSEEPRSGWWNSSVQRSPPGSSRRSAIRHRRRSRHPPEARQPTIGSSYQHQALTLSKQFRRESAR